MPDRGGWRDLERPFLVEPPYDRTPVEVLLSNGIVVEAVYSWGDDATQGVTGIAAGWLKADDLSPLPYQPLRWRPRGYGR